MTLVLCVLAAYLLGSVPFGLLLGFLAGKDIRLHGSKNIGATNVLRVCGKSWGIATFLLDFLKGLAAVWLTSRLAPGALPAPYPAILAALAAVAGHNFPIWLKFKGGKGVATSAGAVAGMMWLPFLVAFTVFVVIVAVTHYLSLGSMIASVVMVAAILILVPDPFGVNLPLFLLGVALCAMLLIRHRQNIARILNGTENRFPPPKAP